MQLFGKEINLPTRKGHKRNASESDNGGLSKFMQVFDNKRNRFIMTGFVGALLLMNLVLAIITIRATDKMNAALGFTIALTLMTGLNVGLLLWRPVSEASNKKRAYMYLANSAILALIWAIAWIWLAAAVVASGKNDDEEDKDSNNQTDPATRMLLVRQDNNVNDANQEPEKPRGATENGCIVLGLFFMFFWIFNAVYVYIRLSKLYPKYAEVNDDNNAFSARMNEDHDEEHGLEMNNGHNTSYHNDDRLDDPYDYNRQNEQYAQPEAYDPLGHDNATPPPRTGYTPHGQMQETAYMPEHHQPTGVYGQNTGPPPIYPPTGDPGYAPYQDDANARTGQFGYQR